jgi:hypothetical protein
MVGRLLGLNPPWAPGEVVPDLLAVALTSLRGTSSLGGEDTGMGAVNTMPTPVPYRVGPEGNTVPLGVVGEGMLCVATCTLVGGAVLTGRMDGAGRESSSPAIGALYTTPVGVPYRTLPAEVVAGTVCCCTVGTELMDCGMGACMIGGAVVLVGTVAEGMMVPTSGASDGGARIAGMDGKGMLMGIVVTTLVTVAVVGMAVVAHVVLMLDGAGVLMGAAVVTAVVTVEATDIAAVVVLTVAVGCVDGMGAAVVVVAAAVTTAVGVDVVTAGMDIGTVTVIVHVVAVAVVTVGVAVVLLTVVCCCCCCCCCCWCCCCCAIVLLLLLLLCVTTGVTIVVLMMGGTAAVTGVGSMTGAVTMSISSPKSACVSMSIGVGCSGVHVIGMHLGGLSAVWELLVVCMFLGVGEEWMWVWEVHLLFS